MGPRASLGSVLFGGVQQRILGALFGNPEKSFYRNELMRLTSSGKGALQRELDRLEQSGLVTVRAVGNQKHYQANGESPIFEELRGIVGKMFGVTDTIDNADRVAGRAEARVPALQESSARYDVSLELGVPGRKLKALCVKYGIRKLSLFGSAARGALRPDSDVDLMVEFDPENTPSLWEFPEMQDEFSRVFGRRVDLVPPQVLDNPTRRKTIAPDLRVLYAA